MVICILIETFTLSLTTIWFALSALVCIFLSFTPMPFIAQFFIFVFLAFLLLIFTRPVIKKKLEKKKVATNYDRIISQTAVVTKKITPLNKGSVKINGMEWTASVKDDSVLEKGSECIIECIEGVTVFVKKI
jgi:membrane protein implicated in regulation of membrane protease activity